MQYDSPPPYVYEITIENDSFQRLKKTIEAHFSDSQFFKESLIPLGGATQSAYLFKHISGDIILKLLKTDLPLSQILWQSWAAAKAGEEGIGPKVLFLDLDQRVLATIKIEGTSLDYTEDSLDQIKLVLKKLKSFHGLFPNEPFDTIKKRFFSLK
jgi:predicted Ser/Thr protein kinase